MSGWFKIHRSIKDHDIWTAEKFTRGQAWIDLIMLARHNDGSMRINGKRMDIMRGQVGWSLRRLSSRWKWSKGKVERFLDELENDSMIDPRENNVNRLITITNYDDYQKNETQTRPLTDPQTVPPIDPQTGTEIRRKRNKEGKKVDFTAPEFIEFEDYCHKNDFGHIARKAFDYYDAAGWKDSRGNKVANWKQKLISVWFDEKKNPKPEKITDHELFQMEVTPYQAAIVANGGTI